MAKVYLEANDSFELSSDAQIFGATGTSETVLINGTPNITLDGNVERVELSGNAADYTYQVVGNIITVYSAGAPVVTIQALNQVAALVFADGAAELALTGLGTATLGTAAIPDVAGAVVPVLDPADTSDTAAGGPVEGQTFTLTSGDDLSGTLVGSAGTTNTDGDDTFAGTDTTYTANDILIGGSGTDALNLSLAANNSAADSVVGIEAVNANFTTFGVPTFNANGIVGTDTTITVTQNQVGGSANANVTNVSTGATVVAGSGVTGTFDVTASGSSMSIDGGAAATVTADLNTGANASTITANTATEINVGNIADATISSTSATAINIEGQNAATDKVAISAVNANASSTVALNTNSDGTETHQVGILDLSGNGGAVTFTFDTGDAPEEITLSGDQDVAIQLAAAQIAGEKVTDSTTAGTTALDIITTGGDADLSDVNVDLIRISAADTGTYTVKDGANVVAAIDLTTVVFDSTENDATGNASEELNLVLTASQTIQATDVSDFETVNLSTEGATAGLAVFALTADATSNVTLANGSVDLTLTAITADTFNATGYTGAITHTAVAANTDEMIFGAGNDSITVTTANKLTLNGGDGIDTLVAKADMDEVDFTSFEILDTTTAITEIDSDQLNTALVITGGDITIDSLTTATVDMSIHTVDPTNVGFIIDGANIDTTVLPSLTAVTMTGNAGADTLTASDNGDTIYGQGGDDQLTAGAKADTLTGGEGYDDFVIATGDSAEDKMDIITDYDVYNTTATDADTITLDSSNDNTATTDAGVVLTVVDDVATGSGVDVKGADADTTAADIDAIVTAGVITLEGADKDVIDTLAEWVDVADLVLEAYENGVTVGTDADDIMEYAVSFVLNGNTYVVTGLDADASADGSTTDDVALDDIVQLTGVTGDLTVGGTAAGDIVLG